MRHFLCFLFLSLFLKILANKLDENNKINLANEKKKKTRSLDVLDTTETDLETTLIDDENTDKKNASLQIISFANYKRENK